VRKAKLLSTAAVALLLSAGAASAQGMKESPERAPAAQQNAPAEKMGPSMKGGEHKSPQTTGQATPDTKSGKAPQTTGQGAPETKSGKSTETTSPSPKSSAGETTQTPSQSMDQGSKSGGASTQSQSTTQQNRTTTGQGAAAGAANLSTEQRTKITTIIRQQKVESAHLNVSVTVGTRIPESVHIYPLPVQVIEIYPQWRGYNYILVGDQIVIIDPRTHEIVAIVEA
jgi:hypothetical protein